MADASDLELCRRAADGDETAFELIVHRHIDSLWRLARSLLSDDYEAEEAVQETFIKAYRSLGSFRGEASLRTWLLAICNRICIDRWRHRRSGVVSLDVFQRERVEQESLELRIMIEEGLQLLPLEERHAFVLVHVLGYSREEAAKICDVPASTFRSRVARARGHLAEMMTETPVEKQQR